MCYQYDFSSLAEVPSSCRACTSTPTTHHAVKLEVGCCVVHLTNVLCDNWAHNSLNFSKFLFQNRCFDVHAAFRTEERALGMLKDVRAHVCHAEQAS